MHRLACTFWLRHCAVVVRPLRHLLAIRLGRFSVVRRAARLDSRTWPWLIAATKRSLRDMLVSRTTQNLPR